MTVPYIGRWILNHWTTREVQISFFPFPFLFLKITYFIFGCAESPRAFFPVAVSGSSSLAAVCGLLIVVASPVAEHRLQAPRASAVAAHRLSTCGSRA